jgi:putative DNA primase/helicase
MNIREVADLTGLCEKTVWSSTAPRGDLRCVKIGTRILYRPSDVAAWIESRGNENIDSAIGPLKPGSCAPDSLGDLTRVPVAAFDDSRSTRSTLGEKDLKELDWGMPEPLPDSLPPVEPFDIDLLPESMRRWNQDIAERMQCPPDFPAVSTMIGLATLVAGKVRIRPKRLDDWEVTPNLYGAVVGRPGLMKTPAIMEPVSILKRFEDREKVKFTTESAEWKNAELFRKRRHKLATDDALKAETEEVGLRMLRAISGCEEEAPTRKRYLVNDTTVEMFGVILNENPSGVLVFRDELTGFLTSLDKENQQHARAFYLEAWNGNSSFTYDRIERGTLDIKISILNLLGGIQPSPLQEYFRGAIRGGRSDDGMLQRIQLMVWPDLQGPWINVDRLPDSTAKQEALQTFEALNDLDPSSIGAEKEESGERYFLRFSAEAQQHFDHWRENLEIRLRSGDESACMESHLSKYRSLVPSLALLIHLAEGSMGPVCESAVCRAIRWANYLESHANRIYGGAMQMDVAGAKTILGKLTKGKLQNGFTMRDVYRKHWSGLADADSAEAAVALLVDYGHLRSRPERTGGRELIQYWVNPNSVQLRAVEGDKSDNPDPPFPFVTSGTSEKWANNMKSSGSTLPTTAVDVSG